MQRVVGDYFMDVQDSLAIFFMMRLGAGACVVIGALLFIYSLLVVHNREIIEPGVKITTSGE
jgi:nitric oxide reductase subunit B